MSAQVSTGDLITATVFNEIERRKPTGAVVATSETRAVNSYAALTTAGPAVTITTGTSAMIYLYCSIANNVAGNVAFMSFKVSGATTVASADAFAITGGEGNAGVESRVGAAFLVTGLTAGSNTFTAEFKAAANTGTFKDRKLIAVPFD